MTDSSPSRRPTGGNDKTRSTSGGGAIKARVRRALRSVLAVRADRKVVVGFLLLGGMHHILHLIPVAAAVSRRGDVHVTIFVRNAGEADACRQVLSALDALPVDIVILGVPRVLRRYHGKIETLIWNFWRLFRPTCLVVAERTSTVIKFFPLPMPVMVHIPHGAGDRARGFEPRIARFDHVIAAGPKDRRRMIAAGVVTPDTCSVSGYIKTAAIHRINPDPARLFQNDRPVVLYNPHFDADLSSWPRFGTDILHAFAAQDRFNLIFAPHVRLFEKADPDLRAEIAAFGRPGQILIDIGSPRSNDMTYTRAADIYLGDVSSQVYEFLVAPRPCVFLSPARRDWQDDPDFAHWRYGEVCFDVAGTMAALARAAERHAGFRQVQVLGVADALGPDSADAIEIAVDQIVEIARRAAP